MTIIGTIRRMLSGGPAQPVFVVDGNGDIVNSFTGGSSTISAPLGRQADAASVSAALSTEDVALLNALLTTSAFQARIPANGQATKANSIPTVPASDWGAFDSTDKFRTSLYGKGTGAGDTAVLLTPAGRMQIAAAAALANSGFSGGPAGFPDNADSSARAVAAALWSYLGNNNYEPQRTPNIFKTAAATASGNTAVWTPTSGKKFRLMRLRISVTADAAQSSGGVITIELRDGTSTAIGFTSSVFVPTVAGTVLTDGWSTNWIDLGNGYLSTTINNVLNINLSSALTSGTVRINVCGTEE